MFENFNTILVLLALTLVVTLVLFRERKQKKSSGSKVTDLVIYPIKSCSGIKISKAVVTRKGLQYDRIFVIVDAKNNFISQRQHPKMAQIKTDIDFASKTLRISGKNMPPMFLGLEEPDVGEVRTVRVWGDSIEGTDMGDDAAAWVTKFIGVPARIVRFVDSFVRKTDPEFAPNGQSSFADGFPFLIASQASLQAVNDKLDTKIPMDNFRPNIIVDGKQPFEEDTWKSVEIHNMKYSVCKPCSRCKMPNVDQTTGVMDADLRVSEALKTFRTGKQLGLRETWKNNVYFGQNLDHEGKEGEIRVGDDVFLLQ